MTARTPSAALGHRHRAVRWLLAGLLLGLSLAVGAQQATRIGYVDLKRLLDNAPQMAQSNERLRLEFAERDRALKADEARLTELKERQRRESGMTPATDASVLAAEIEALDRRVRRTRETLREELRRRSDEETELRWREISEAVAAYARENAYDLVTHGPVFYASPSIDITDQVLTRLRQQNNRSSGNGN